MAFSRHRNIGVIFVLVLMLQLPTAVVRGAVIADFSVTNSREDLLLYLKVKDAFTKPIRDAVASGLPTTFSFFIILEEVRRFWANQTLVEETLTHTIKYSNLKKEFVVTRSWEEEAPVPLKTIEEAQERMTRIDGFKVLRLDRLRKGNTYRIQAKAKLSRMNLPFYLRTIMVMASMWEFETDWHTIEFTY